MLGEGLEQLCVFAVFVVLGVGFCAIYIFFAGLTKSRLAGVIFDSIFGAVAIYVVWKTNLEVNNGECRLFIFIGLVLGSVISFVTCKRTLDKLSAMLYNLFTTKLVDKDGKTILQEMDSGVIRSGDTGTGIAPLHATGITDTMVVTKRTRRGIRATGRRSKVRRGKTTKTSRLHENKRVRKGMGRTARPNQW